jgi:hypothetical protein
MVASRPKLKVKYDASQITVTHEGLLLNGDLVESVLLSGEFPIFSSTAPHRSIDSVTMVDGSQLTAEDLILAVKGFQRDFLLKQLVVVKKQSGGFVWPSRLGFVDPIEVERQAAANAKDCGSSAVKAWMSKH